MYSCEMVRATEEVHHVVDAEKLHRRLATIKLSALLLLTIHCGSKKENVTNGYNKRNNKRTYKLSRYFKVKQFS